MRAAFTLFLVAVATITWPSRALAEPFLTLPLADANITSTWDPNRIVPGYGLVPHDGIDFDDNASSTIVAAAAGQVVATQPSDTGDYGRYVKVCHDNDDDGAYDDFCTLYAHMASVSVSDWQLVDRGEQLGVVGESGTATGPHLHFELRDSAGKKLDPFDLYSKSVGDYPDADSPGSAEPSDHHWTAWPPEGPDSCHTESEPILAEEASRELLVLTDPDGERYDVHAWIQEPDQTAWTLLDRGDMGDGFANPVIDDEGKPEHKEKWLVGDVGRGAEDGSWDDLVLITDHGSGDVRVQVWLANGDGTFEGRDRWTTLSKTADFIFVGPVDGDEWADLVLGRLKDGDIEWRVCGSNGSDAFGSCDVWADFGTSLSSVYLLGDVSGDGQADLLRGYEHSDSDTCPIHSDHPKMRWRLLEGGKTSSASWLKNWGCPESTYVLGDFDGDSKGREDLLQVRFDTAKTGHVFVATSSGSTGTGTGSWKADFGSEDHKYWVVHADDDGLADLVSYRETSDESCSDGYGKLNLVRSKGSGEPKDERFTTKDTVISCVHRESKGALRFGHFGDVLLWEGEETTETCGDGVSSMGTASVSVVTTEACEPGLSGYALTTDDESWVPEDLDAVDLGECTEAGDTALITAGDELTAADCSELLDSLDEALADGRAWWEASDGATTDTLTVVLDAGSADGTCLAWVSP